MNLTLNLISFVGIFGLCFVAWVGSEDRRALPIKVILWGLGLQLAIGLLVFQLPITRDLITQLGNLFNALIDAADAGSRFLFGELIVPKFGNSVGPGTAGRWIARAVQDPYVAVPGDRLGKDFLDFGYIFAFRALPQVIFFSAVVGLLYRLGLI